MGPASFSSSLSSSSSTAAASSSSSSSSSPSSLSSSASFPSSSWGRHLLLSSPSRGFAWTVLHIPLNAAIVLLGSVLELLTAHGALTRGAQVVAGGSVAVMVACCAGLDACVGVGGLALSLGHRRCRRCCRHCSRHCSRRRSRRSSRRNSRSRSRSPSHSDADGRGGEGGGGGGGGGEGEWSSSAAAAGARRACAVHTSCAAALLALPLTHDFQTRPLLFLLLLNALVLCDVCAALHMQQPPSPRPRSPTPSASLSHPAAAAAATTAAPVEAAAALIACDEGRQSGEIGGLGKCDRRKGEQSTQQQPKPTCAEELGLTAPLIDPRF
jgi:hypothetical protein